MFGYVTFNVKYYILSQMFYKTNWVTITKHRHKTPPQVIYNSHYGNGAPAMFTS